MILIAGGAGYIGGTVASLLMERGHTAVIYDNLSHSLAASVPPGAEFVEGNVADVAKLNSLLQSRPFTAVMHFAAFIEAGESMSRPGLYFRNNTASALGLLEAMVASGITQLIFSSTAAVYGEPAATPILEDAALQPTNPYGESKLLVERMLTWFHRIHGLSYASLRYFNVAGALPERGEAHEPETHLIPLVLDVALGRRDAVRIFGQDYPTPDGTCIRDYIHVLDLAEAHLLALDALSQRHRHRPGEDRPVADRMIYNLGNGRGFSVLEVIESARRVTGRPIPVEVMARRPGDPAVLVASSEKITRELGWEPKFPQLDQIIASAWKWHQQRYK